MRWSARGVRQQRSLRPERLWATMVSVKDRVGREEDRARRAKLAAAAESDKDE